MKLFDVYPLQDITVEKAKGVWVWDNQGQKYLDMYGGHAVISIGHTHPHYVRRLTAQLKKIGFLLLLASSPTTTLRSDLETFGDFGICCW